MIGLVAITLPEFFDTEAQCINALFASGLRLLHLRKPEASFSDVEKLLAAIDSRYYNRIAMHYHHSLAVKYSLGGVHLSAVTPSVPNNWHGRISRSCHSLEELQKSAGDCSYAFLSPIFDSISKVGYSSNFSLNELQRAATQNIINSNVVALGGITPENCSVVRSIGFGGAAVLGGLWISRDAKKIVARFEQYNAAWQ